MNPREQFPHCPHAAVLWTLQHNDRPGAIVHHAGAIHEPNLALQRLLQLRDPAERLTLAALSISLSDFHDARSQGSGAVLQSVVDDELWDWSLYPLDDDHCVLTGVRTDPPPYTDPIRLRDWIDRQDVFLSVANREGLIIFANAALLKAHGLVLSDIVGQPFAADLPPDSVREFEIAGQRATPQAPSYSIETSVRLADGELRWQAWTVQVLYDADGSVDGYLSVGRDITRRYEIAQERERLLHELNSFAHNVAHDLKHPIHTLLGFLELLGSDENLTAQQRYLLDKANLVGNQLNAIVVGLLRLGELRENAVEFQPLDLAALLDVILQRLEALIEERGAQIIIVEGRWPVPVGYPTWVGEAIANYVSNAIKYGGTPPIVRIWAERHNEWVYFYVEDNGIGVDIETRKHLFQQPIVHDDEPDSHGLGLPIVRRVIERHGGTVGFQEGRHLGGSCFYFTLPTRQAGD